MDLHDLKIHIRREIASAKRQKEFEQELGETGPYTDIIEDLDKDIDFYGSILHWLPKEFGG